METVEIKLYKFSELSEEVKEKAINQYRENEYKHTPWFIDEVNQCFEKFADIFSIEWRNIDYEEPYRNDYHLTFDDNILNLTGQRLATYIWNNYKSDLFKHKYLKSFDDHKNHKRVKNYTAKRTGNKYCSYYSAIQLDNSCVLTGMCYDHNILDPIYEFLNKPNDRIDFETLLNDCINSLCHAVSSEIEYQYSDEAITETIEANDYDFTEDGEMY